MCSSAIEIAAAPSIGLSDADSPRLILASASPARAAVMRQAGLTAPSEPARVDEEEIKLSLATEQAGPAQLVFKTNFGKQFAVAVESVGFPGFPDLTQLNEPGKIL